MVQLAQARDLEAIRLAGLVVAQQASYNSIYPAPKPQRGSFIIIIERVVRTWHAFRLYHGQRFIDLTSEQAK